MWRSIAVFSILGLGVGCAKYDGEVRGRDPEQDRVAIESLANRLAESISRLDAEGAAEGIPRDSTVVYVSDGSVYRGVDYVPTLESFYSDLDSLQFDWTRTEISFPTTRSAVLIGWASIRAKPKGGTWADAPAIFTIFYRLNDEGRWEYVTSQKTTIRR